VLTARGRILPGMITNRLIAAATGRSAAESGRVFRKPSSLRWQVVRMITTNSLAAFTKEVAPQNRLAERPVTEASGVRRQMPGEGAPFPAEQVAQRRLEAVPPAPTKPLPRGSLLDLRV
jgi:hypothetical protein